MKSTEIIEKYYNKKSALYRLLIKHSEDVRDLALDIARKRPGLEIDCSFISEAAMLHDIGIFMTDAPSIKCCGDQPYICHGYLGSELLQQEGYPLHALVCERHTGTGLTIDMIRKQQLPLPLRDMMPLSLEEQIICFADKFYSKSEPNERKSVEAVRKNLAKHGSETVTRFDQWCNLFLP